MEQEFEHIKNKYKIEGKAGRQPVSRFSAPEILAPAGNYKALEAAVKAGADAVYLAGSMFGARAYAGNFSDEELIRAIDYCHLFGIRVYLTVNTLFKESEISVLSDFVKPFYKEGLDAVIVQDLGAADILKKEFPDLSLHASTQMSISSHCGADFLKNFGFSRIVSARELSLEEIKDIKKKTDIEIETFVHGAMCFAFSGKCLMSSFLGGRSGNRGRCAQPCRKIYEISAREKAGYLMSLKDMCTLEVLPRLIDAGIDSFKIEGRMKNGYYVAACTKAYKNAVQLYEKIKIENKAKNWEDLPEKAKLEYEETALMYTNELKDIYNRGGFGSGYYFQNRGKTMFSGCKPSHMGVKIGTVEKISKSDVFIRLSKDMNSQDVIEIRNDSGLGGSKQQSDKAQSISSRDSKSKSKEKSAESPSIYSKENKAAELTVGTSGKAGKIAIVKGKELKKIRQGMAVYRIRNNFLINDIEEKILKPERKLEARAFVEAIIGKPLKITIENEEAKAELEGKIVEEAQNRPTTKEELTEKMNKTSGSGVKLETECLVSENAFVNMSAFNEQRRAAVLAFKEEIIGRYKRQPMMVRQAKMYH